MSLKSQSRVVWVYKGQEILWKPKRTPALGWNELTLSEALLDSALIYLCKGNIEETKKKVSYVLTMIRSQIEDEKKIAPMLLNRCRHRETVRTRCNRFPVFKEELCEYHYNLVHRGDV